MGFLGKIFSAIPEAAAKAYMKRVERKMAKESADAKIKQAKVEGATQVTLQDQEVEQLMVRGKDATWTDEYVTVSFVSIVNLFVVGGIATAFGYPQMMTGVVEGVTALVNAGVDMGFIIQAVALAGVGLTVWRKI